MPKAFAGRDVAEGMWYDDKLDNKVTPIVINSDDIKEEGDLLEAFKQYYREKLAGKSIAIGDTGWVMVFGKSENAASTAAKSTSRPRRYAAGKKIADTLEKAYHMGSRVPVHKPSEGKKKARMIEKTGSFERFGYPILLNGEKKILWCDGITKKGSDEKTALFYEFGVSPVNEETPEVRESGSYRSSVSQLPVEGTLGEFLGVVKPRVSKFLNSTVTYSVIGPHAKTWSNLFKELKVLYADKNRAPEWHPLADAILAGEGDLRNPDGSIILTKEDIVKYQNTGKSSYSMQAASNRALELLTVRADERAGELLIKDWVAACEAWAQGEPDKRTGHQHNLSDEQILHLPVEIADPVMVFEGKAATLKYHALVVLTEMKVGAKSVMAAIHLDRKVGRTRIDVVASAYERDNNNLFKTLRVLYADKNRVPEWHPVAGATFAGEGDLRNPDDSIILTKEDIVKYQNTGKSTCERYCGGCLLA